MSAGEWQLSITKFIDLTYSLPIVESVHDSSSLYSDHATISVTRRRFTVSASGIIHETLASAWAVETPARAPHPVRWPRLVVTWQIESEERRLFSMRDSKEERKLLAFLPAASVYFLFPSVFISFDLRKRNIYIARARKRRMHFAIKCVLLVSPCQPLLTDVDCGQLLLTAVKRRRQLCIVPVIQIFIITG